MKFRTRDQHLREDGLRAVASLVAKVSETAAHATHRHMRRQRRSQEPTCKQHRCRCWQPAASWPPSANMSSTRLRLGTKFGSGCHPSRPRADRQTLKVPSQSSQMRKCRGFCRGGFANTQSGSGAAIGSDPHKQESCVLGQRYIRRIRSKLLLGGVQRVYPCFASA